LVPFLLFHVIIAAVQFTPATAYALASVAAAGLWLLLVGEILQWIPSSGLTFQGQSVHFTDRPFYAAAWLAFFTATLFIAAALVSRVMRRLRRGVADLARTTADLGNLNNKLSGLYAMVGAIAAVLALSVVLVVRGWFGMLFVVALSAGLAAIAFYASAAAARFTLVFMAVQLAASVFSRADYLFTPVAQTAAGSIPSDVARMSQALLLPYWFWGTLCGALSAAVLIVGLRGYMARGR